MAEFIFLFSFQGRIYSLTILSNLLTPQLMRKTDLLIDTGFFNAQTSRKRLYILSSLP